MEGILALVVSVIWYFLSVGGLVGGRSQVSCEISRGDTVNLYLLPVGGVAGIF